MNALAYLFRKTLKNRIKIAVRKPVTYFWLFFIVIYGIFIPISLKSMLSTLNLATPAGMTMVVTIFCFWLLPANIISYSKRKGLLFKKSDVHMLFPTPISPKMMLLNTHIKTLGTYLLFSIIIMMIGIFLFGMSWLQTLLFFIASMILENILESSIMVICYGNERLTEKQRKIFVVMAYAVMLSFVAIGAIVYFEKGLSLDSVLYFLNCDAIQYVPIVGWYISLMRLIILGPATINIICSSLYLTFVLTCFIIASRLKCTGEYFEDAEKFAEDYDELKKKNAEGISAKFGKKEKFKEAKVTYKGGGAKAIFYKQLLEYKKTKGFFLDKTNLILVVVGNIWIYFTLSDIESSIYKVFIMPGIMMYLVLLTSAVNGKWGKEIKSPYTFLIPDSPVKKLWYSTVIEHFKNLIYGVLFAVPCAIMLKISPLVTALCILIYMVTQANKLYSLVLMEVLVGTTLGRIGKQLFHMFLQGIPMILAGIGMLIGYLAQSIILAFVIMTAVLVGCLVIFMIFAALGFEKMETA